MPNNSAQFSPCSLLIASLVCDIFAERCRKEKVVVARRNDQQVSGDTHARERGRNYSPIPQGRAFLSGRGLSLFRAAIFQILRAKRREYDCAVVANRFDRATIIYIPPSGAVESE